LRGEVKILQDRANSFLRLAEEKLTEEDYDLASFASEQAAQLFLKSKALELLGEIPRTHSIRELLGYLAKVKGDSILKYLHEGRKNLARLEDAYLQARYIPRKYTGEEAEELLETAKKVMKLGEDP